MILAVCVEGPGADAAPNKHCEVARLGITDDLGNVFLQRGLNSSTSYGTLVGVVVEKGQASQFVQLLFTQSPRRRSSSPTQFVFQLTDLGTKLVHFAPNLCKRRDQCWDLTCGVVLQRLRQTLLRFSFTLSLLLKRRYPSFNLGLTVRLATEQIAEVPQVAKDGLLHPTVMVACPCVAPGITQRTRADQVARPPTAAASSESQT